MNAIVAVARASVLEHSRRKLILVFIGGSVVITAVLAWLIRDATAGLFLGGGRALVQDITPRAAVVAAAMGFLQFFALFAALAVSMGNIGQPFSSGEALTVLARPVARWQYALGRISASVMIVTALAVLLALESGVLQLVAGIGLEGRIWGHWATVGFNLVVVVAITTLLSVFVGTPVLAAIAGFFANQFLGVIGGIHRVVQAGDLSGPFARAIEVLWHVTPKFLTSPIQFGGRQAQAFVVQNTPGLVTWAVAWLLGLVVLTLYLTSRKEA